MKELALLVEVSTVIFIKLMVGLAYHFILIVPVVDEVDEIKDHDIAKGDINNEFKRVEKGGYKYNDNCIIKITENHKGEYYSSPRKYKTYAVIESDKVSKYGFNQIDRRIYNKEEIMVKQIHSGHHNRSKNHPYSKSGEHSHIYKWNKEGKSIYRDVRELTKKQRREHKDILKE